MAFQASSNKVTSRKSNKQKSRASMGEKRHRKLTRAQGRDAALKRTNESIGKKNVKERTRPDGSKYNVYTDRPEGEGPRVPTGEQKGFQREQFKEAKFAQKTPEQKVEDQQFMENFSKGVQDITGVIKATETLAPLGAVAAGLAGEAAIGGIAQAGVAGASAALNVLKPTAQQNLMKLAKTGQTLFTRTATKAASGEKFTNIGGVKFPMNTKIAKIEASALTKLASKYKYALTITGIMSGLIGAAGHKDWATHLYIDNVGYQLEMLTRAAEKTEDPENIELAEEMSLAMIEASQSNIFYIPGSFVLIAKDFWKVRQERLRIEAEVEQ